MERVSEELKQHTNILNSRQKWQKANLVVYVPGQALHQTLRFVFAVSKRQPVSKEFIA